MPRLAVAEPCSMERTYWSVRPRPELMCWLAAAGVAYRLRLPQWCLRVLARMGYLSPSVLAIPQLLAQGSAVLRLVVWSASPMERLLAREHCLRQQAKRHR